MIIADMKYVKAIKNGLVNIQKVYYGSYLVWQQGEDFDNPYDREVEYLLAKDTDTYIVTELMFKDLTKYNFEIKGWCGLGATMLFGSRDTAASGDTNQVAMIHSSNGQYQYRIMNGTQAGSITANNTLPHTFVWNGQAMSLTMDGTAVSVSTAAKSNAPKIDSRYPLVLFGCNSGGYVDNMGKDRCIYYFKVWYEDELIIDYIPVVDNNGIPCFYDNVTEKLVRCGGAGTFAFAEKEQ